MTESTTVKQKSRSKTSVSMSRMTEYEADLAAMKSVRKYVTCFYQKTINRGGDTNVIEDTIVVKKNLGDDEIIVSKKAHNPKKALRLLRFYRRVRGRNAYKKAKTPDVPVKPSNDDVEDPDIDLDNVIKTEDRNIETKMNTSRPVRKIKRPLKYEDSLTDTEVEMLQKRLEEDIKHRIKTEEQVTLASPDVIENRADENREKRKDITAIDHSYEEAQTELKDVNVAEVDTSVSVKRNKVKKRKQGGGARNSNNTKGQVSSVPKRIKSEQKIEYSCEECKRHFKSKCMYENHMRTHTGEKPFQCNECGIAFALKSNLTAHSIIHSDARPFACTKCDWTFKSKKRLNDHQRVHTLEKLHVCELCGQSFKVKRNLITHKLVHEGIKPYQCDKCDFATVRQPSLVAHMWTHRPVKRFVCTEPGCDRTYATKAKYLFHMNSHYNIRPYSCALCECTYIRHDYLKNHMEVAHNGIKPYSCEPCGKVFSTLGTFKTHIKNIHVDGGVSIICRPPNTDDEVPVKEEFKESSENIIAEDDVPVVCTDAFNEPTMKEEIVNNSTEDLTQYKNVEYL